MLLQCHNLCENKFLISKMQRQLNQRTNYISETRVFSRQLQKQTNKQTKLTYVTCAFCEFNSRLIKRENRLICMVNVIFDGRDFNWC